MNVLARVRLMYRHAHQPRRTKKYEKDEGLGVDSVTATARKRLVRARLVGQYNQIPYQTAEGSEEVLSSSTRKQE
jgi:hypothetical protein